MTNIKRNIIMVASALIVTVLSAGCATESERPVQIASSISHQDAYSYDSGSSSEDVSDNVSESDMTEDTSAADDSDTDSSTSSSTSVSVPKAVICTINRDDLNNSIEAASSSSDTGTSKPVVCTIDRDSLNGDTASSSSSSASASPAAISDSVDAIKAVCGLKSKVETDIGACIVNTYNDHNPYDVAYDYGKAYGAFVSACDWDLVFDADFYAKSFPLLAMQYHDDKALLLEHFQTIGIHEGRQGSASFNVGSYKANCDSGVRSAFGNNYEGYYFYYMLNYESEKSVNTASGSKLQQKTIMTALQAAELDGVNMYRREAGVFEIEFDSELAAFANYRAYLNSHDGWKAHDWFYKDDVVTDYIMDLYDAQGIGENTTTSTCADANCTSHRCNYGEIRYEYYRASESHYKAMIASKYDLIGCGNCYKAGGVISQFDTFINL